MTSYLDGTDAGFSELIELHLRGQVFYNETTASYYVWNPSTLLWEVDRKGNRLKTRINATLIRSIDTYHRLILDTPDGPERDKKFRRVCRLRQQARTNASLNAIQDYLKGSSFSRCELLEKLDKTPYLIPMSRSVLDCRTGNVRPRTKDDFFSFELKYQLSGDFGPFPEWVQNLFSNLKDSRECTEYLQMLLGYFLTGSTREQMFAIFRGNKGKNGKGVILSLLEKCMGPFIYKMNKGLCIQSESCSNRGASLAKLIFSRLSYIDETRKEDKFRDDFIKDISGEGKLTYRPLYQSEQTVDVNTKFLCITNFSPRFDGTDSALVRRILIVPFEKYFRTKNESGYCKNDPNCIEIKNNNLKYELLEAHAQFFNWIAAGAVRYYKNLGRLVEIMPKSFKTSKRKYIHENDPVQQFIQEFCEIDPEYRISVVGFQTKLRKECGLLTSEYSSQAISKMMLEKGFDKSRQRVTFNGTTYNTKCYGGIRIRPNEEWDSE